MNNVRKFGKTNYKRIATVIAVSGCLAFGATAVTVPQAAVKAPVSNSVKPTVNGIKANQTTKSYVNGIATTSKKSYVNGIATTSKKSYVNGIAYKDAKSSSFVNGI